MPRPWFFVLAFVVHTGSEGTASVFFRDANKNQFITRKTKHKVNLLKATSQDIGFFVFVFVFL